MSRKRGEAWNERAPGSKWPWEISNIFGFQDVVHVNVLLPVPPGTLCHLTRLGSISEQSSWICEGWFNLHWSESSIGGDLNCTTG